MGTIEGIRKHGFRKWYERQLVESHLWLVTMVLALVVMASGFELMSARDRPADLLFHSTLVVSGAALAGFAWRRYAVVLQTAEHVGHQAVCPGCKRYGFRPVPASENGAQGAPMQLVASCRRCGHRWPIDTPR